MDRSPLDLMHQNYHLRSAHVTLNAFALLNFPDLVELAAEDAAWCFSYEEWLRLRPNRLRTKRYARWLEDGKELFVERHQLFLTARSFGL